MPMYDYDAVVAGGGISGVAAAAALREFGWSVLVVEPGQRCERRLAGELLHPSGVAGLVELGLFDAEAFAGAVPIDGFTVHPGPYAAGCGIRLRYSRQVGAAAIALAHPILRGTLQAAARALGHVTYLEGARVRRLDRNIGREAIVSIVHGGRPRAVSCRLLIAADGASSPLRAMAGIVHRRRDISTIAGYLVSADLLPDRRFGHVFIGGPAVGLAYGIGDGLARVLVDRPIDAMVSSGGRAGSLHDDLSAMLPRALHQAIGEAAASRASLSFRSAEVVAAATARGNMVLVGDAGGSCHPLTATGMTAGIRDALRLRDVLRAYDGDIAAALAAYGRARRTAQGSRRIVASALHDTLSRSDPTWQLLRSGLLRYWIVDERGRRATMALLDMSDERITSALWQLLRVTCHGLIEHWRDGRSSPAARLGIGARLVMALAALVTRQFVVSIRTR